MSAEHLALAIEFNRDQLTHLPSTLKQKTVNTILDAQSEKDHQTHVTARALTMSKEQRRLHIQALLADDPDLLTK